LSDTDNIGAFMLLKGAILKLVGRGDEALNILDSLIAMKDQVKNERYVIPFGLWEKGELLYKRGRIAEAEVVFSEVLAFKGNYDVCSFFSFFLSLFTMSSFLSFIFCSSPMYFETEFGSLIFKLRRIRKQRRQQNNEYLQEVSFFPSKQTP
jgi:hypothetical protein